MKGGPEKMPVCQGQALARWHDRRHGPQIYDSEHLWCRDNVNVKKIPWRGGKTNIGFCIYMCRPLLKGLCITI